MLEPCLVPLWQDFAATLGEGPALLSALDGIAAILDATIARDIPTATKLLRAHCMRTIDVIEEAEFHAASEARLPNE